MTTHATLFTYLRTHCRDEANVTPLPVIAAALWAAEHPGVKPKPNQLRNVARQVQLLIAACNGIDGDDVVVSRCRKPMGLYITDDPRQMGVMIAQLQSRAQADSARAQAIINRHPSLRPVVRRTPPLTVTPHGPAVVAQMAFDALEATA